MKTIIQFFLYLDDFLHKIIDFLVLKTENGIHPKHRLTRYYKFFIDHLESSHRVLDIGCGVGIVAHHIASKAREVIGIELEKNNVDIAREKFKKPNLRFILGDATTIKFEGSFDRVVLSNVLEHIENRIDFLKKIRSLAPVLLIRVPMINRDWLPLYRKELGLPYFSDPGHFTEYTLESFFDEIEKAGLVVEEYSIQFGEIWAVVKTQ